MFTFKTNEIEKCVEALISEDESKIYISKLQDTKQFILDVFLQGEKILENPNSFGYKAFLDYSSKHGEAIQKRNETFIDNNIYEYQKLAEKEYKKNLAPPYSKYFSFELVDPNNEILTLGIDIETLLSKLNTQYEAVKKIKSL